MNAWCDGPWGDAGVNAWGVDNAKPNRATILQSENAAIFKRIVKRYEEGS